MKKQIEIIEIFEKKIYKEKSIQCDMDETIFISSKSLEEIERGIDELLDDEIIEYIEDIVNLDESNTSINDFIENFNI